MDTETKPASKPGIRSTEFWLPGGALAGLQAIIVEGTASEAIQVSAAIGVGAIAVTYIVSRTFLKLRGLPTPPEVTK